MTTNDTPEPVMRLTSITELLAGGDWACARHDPRALGQMARFLAPCVAAPEQMELDAIAGLAATDLAAACARWAGMAVRLRGRLPPLAAAAAQ